MQPGLENDYWIQHLGIGGSHRVISLEQHYCPSKEDREAEGDSGGSLWGLLEGSLPEEITGAAAAGREGE